MPGASEIRPADLAAKPAGQRLLTAQELARRLRLDDGRSPEAVRKALERIWAEVQDVRADRNQPPLKRVRLGSRRYYDPSVVEAIIEALSFEF